MAAGVKTPGVRAERDAVGSGIPICANKACAGVCCTLFRSPTVLRPGVANPFLGDDVTEGAGDSGSGSVVLCFVNLAISSTKEVRVNAMEKLCEIADSSDDIRSVNLSITSAICKSIRNQFMLQIVFGNKETEKIFLPNYHVPQRQPVRWPCGL